MWLLIGCEIRGVYESAESFDVSCLLGVTGVMLIVVCR